MKIQRSQLKEIIKECIKELLAEGSLNEMFVPQGNQQMLHMNQPKQQLDPRVRSVAASVGKTPKERAMFESILSDTLNTAAEQQAGEVDPQYWNQEYQNQLQQQNNNTGMVHVPQINQMYGMQQQPQQPQYPAMMQQGYGNTGYQQQPMNNMGAGYSSPWARLAFNSPISNRPKDGVGVSNSGFLPGVNGSSGF